MTVGPVAKTAGSLAEEVNGAMLNHFNQTYFDQLVHSIYHSIKPEKWSVYTLYVGTNDASK